MSELLAYSMFHEVLFPKEQLKSSQDATSAQVLMLHKLMRYQPPADLDIYNSSIVIFDFETTGLDARDDRIIEIGAQKFRGFELVDEYATLVHVDMELPKIVYQMSGITQDMLVGKPAIEEVLGHFLKFMEGSLLVAHNAEFDWAFLAAACQRIGIDLNWPCFCTLKMARLLLPALPSKNLDSLAQHYGLEFEARHRSIGDVKVTSQVLKKFLIQEKPELKQWQHLADFVVN